MNWEEQWSNGVTLKKPLFGELIFKFPKSDGVHYIVKEVGASSGNAIEMKFTIKPATAKFVSSDGGVPRVRLYFQREGDDMMAGSKTQFYRWWSNPASVIVAPGTFTLSVPLHPNLWSSVLGKGGSDNPSAFRDALSHAQYMGFTFGGNFFGHGVWATTDNAKFKLNSFRVK